MKKKLKNLLPTKIWLSCLTGLCFFFIGLTFFTDVLTVPMQKITSEVIIPMQRGVNGIGLWLTEKSNLFASMEDLQKENATLKDKLEKAENENLQMKENQVELTELRELYSLDNSYSSYKKTGANVIGRSSDNWYNTFTIDKGSKDGIQKDMNVIAGNGLVGIVCQVSENYSTVRSIIDDSSNVSAMLLNTSNTCTVCGDLQLMERGIIRLKYLDKNVKIHDGDMIITSNISEKYLPGILVGYAKDVSLDSNELTQSGYIVPAADFKQIQRVLVILEKKTSIKE